MQIDEWLARASRKPAAEYVAAAVKGATGERAVARALAAVKQSRYMRKRNARLTGHNFDPHLTPKERALLAYVIKQAPGRFPRMEEAVARDVPYTRARAPLVQPEAAQSPSD